MGRLETRTAYVFLAPYLLVTLIFTVGVIVFALYISFNQFNLFTWPPQWVGLANYVRSFAPNGQFVHSLVNIAWYVLIVVPVQTAVALALASLLNQRLHGITAFRTVYYAPSVTSSVVITMIFWWMYLNTGYINFAFSKVWEFFGGQWTSVTWLNDPRGLIQLIVGALGGHISQNLWYLNGPSVTWMAIMFQNIFTTAPTFMIMFLAALQDIPPTLYEAASIDGASGWERFRYVTLPMLRPVMLLVIVLGTIGCFQIFDQVKILTAGGPLDTTLTPVFLIYSEALGTNAPPRMGYASAMAFLLALIIFAFTFLQRRMIETGTEQY